MGIPCGSPNLLRFSDFTKALLTPRLTTDGHALIKGGQVLTAQSLSDGLEEETREILDLQRKDAAGRLQGRCVTSETTPKATPPSFSCPAGVSCSITPSPK